MKMLWIAATLMLLAGCGGGSNSTSTPGDTDQVTTADVVAAIAEATHAQAQQIAAMQTQQTADEVKLAKVTNFGHAPGASSTESVHTDSITAQRMMSEPQVIVTAVSYGPCSDMGQQIGASGDPTGATVLYYKQCPINGQQYTYGAVVQGGAVSQPPNGFLWFDQPNCQGNAIIFENDGSYNRLSLDGGVVFTSPVDGVTELMVTAAQTAATMTSQSIYAAGCINASETHTAYMATQNDTNVTGVPTAVPSNFVN